MVKIPNTYTTSDGSIYRIEADGSVSKIKEGRVQSNEPSSNFQIMPDGKIYQIESDGSITYLGNVKDRQYPIPPAYNFENKKNSPKLSSILIAVILWVIVAVTIIVAASYHIL